MKMLLLLTSFVFVQLSMLAQTADSNSVSVVPGAVPNTKLAESQIEAIKLAEKYRNAPFITPGVGTLYNLDSVAVQVSVLGSATNVVLEPDIRTKVELLLRQSHIHVSTNMSNPLLFVRIDALNMAPHP